jgi:mRNA-degrading endonuclease RelE of RelBE toxin-antitoxin system
VTWSIETGSSAQRSLNRLPGKVRDAALTVTYGQLAENSRRVGTPLGREPNGLHPARRGSCRLVNQVLEDRVLVRSSRGVRVPTSTADPSRAVHR